MVDALENSRNKAVNEDTLPKNLEFYTLNSNNNCNGIPNEALSSPSLKP